MDLYNFTQEKLSVDYITFNLRNGKNQIQKLSQLFHQIYQFDSYQIQAETRVKTPLIVQQRQYHVNFVLNVNQSNTRTIAIHFTGIHAQYFYTILKDQNFQWQIFFELPDLSLSRFDINFISNDFSKISSLINFFERSIQKYKKRFPAALCCVAGRNTEQPSLSITSRTGDNFLRVYKNQFGFLKFEFEIKKRKARNYTKFLVQNCFIDFENDIISGFYFYLQRALVLDTDYTNWLMYKLRKRKNRNTGQSTLISNYFNKDFEIQDESYFYRFLQFLSFARTKECDSQKELLNHEVYYNLKFNLVSFAKTININYRSTYQRQKLIHFFNSLQSAPPNMEWFSDEEFVSIIGFPIVKIQKNYSDHTKLVVQVSVSEKFYNWKYPFYFPNSFFNFDNKDDLRVKVAIIKSFSEQIPIRKQFLIYKFLNKFNSISNKRKTKIKQNIIQQFRLLQKERIIENDIKLLKKNKSFITTQELTIQDINSAFLIVYYEVFKEK